MAVTEPAPTPASAPLQKPPYTGQRVILVEARDWPHIVHALRSSLVELPPIPDSANGLPCYLAAPRRPHPAAPGTTELSDRERQVLVRMSRGKTNGDIARELYLSEDTVKTHGSRLFRKLGVGDRAHAVNRGWELGLLGGGS